MRACEIFASAETDLRYSSSPRIVFETAVVKACLPETDADVLTLSRRIERLEAALKNGVPAAAAPVREEPARPAHRESAQEEFIPFPPEEDAPPESFSSAPAADLFSPRKEEEKVNALAPDKRRAAFGYFMRSLRKTVRSGVLFTMCQDLEPSFEGDTYVLSTDNEIIYRSLNKEDHYKAVAQALEGIGITDFRIALRAPQRIPSKRIRKN